MTHERKQRLLSSIFAILAGVPLGGFHTTGAAAQDPPPGVTIAANMAFAPPTALGAFEAMTFVLTLHLVPGFHCTPTQAEVR